MENRLASFICSDVGFERAELSRSMAQLVGSFTACYSSGLNQAQCMLRTCMCVCTCCASTALLGSLFSLPPPHPPPTFLLQAAAAALPFFSIYFLSSPLVFMLLYLWSREQPTANVSIMGFVTVPVSGGNGEVAKGLV